MKWFTYQNIRRIYSVFFFILFVVLLLLADFQSMKGYDVSLFHKIDPLVAISTFLTSWTVYKGLILSIIIIAGTAVFGRFFCSWICPMGILNQWVSRFFNRRRAADDYRVNSYRPVFVLKYYILAVILVLAVFGILQAGLFDPISIITRSFSVSLLPAFNYLVGHVYIKQPLFYGGMLISILFVIILLANRTFTRFWCRVLCPLGGLLGIISGVSILRIRRDVEKCTDCQKCLRHCHGACSPHEELRASECMVCMNCVEDCPQGALSFGLAGSDSSVHAPFDLNRRRLLETAVAGAVLFPMMRSVVNARTDPRPNVIRPPGSLNENAFLSRCIKCGECMRVCPTNVIQPSLLEGGVEGLWTPILMNKIGYCEFNCVLCSQVCPTGAIVQLTVEQKTGTSLYNSPIKLGTAFYDRGRCLPWSMDTECIVCEEMCPVSPKAIWFQEEKIIRRDGTEAVLKRPRVDTSRCIGCGICENKCPVHDRPAVKVTSIGESRSAVNRMILSQ
jgi:polyferredoxin